MSAPRVIVIGGTGLIGSAVAAHLDAAGCAVTALSRSNYAAHAGAQADVVINCNGNSYRFKANQNPRWDFDASVLSVENSLFDFPCRRYIHVSTIDVYPDLGDPAANREDAPIDASRLHPYGFHKWLAERLVERFGSDPLILRAGTVIGPGLKKGPLYDLLHGAPLHMSPDSELSLIDTGTIARAIAQFIQTPPPHRILNLTGTGPARVRDFCAAAGLGWRLAPGADAVVHRYHVNNDRFQKLFPVDNSMGIAERFLATQNKPQP